MNPNPDSDPVRRIVTCINCYYWIPIRSQIFIFFEIPDLDSDPIKGEIIKPLFKGHDVEAVQGVPQHNAGVEGQRHEAPLAQSPPFPRAAHGSEPFVQGGPSALEPEM